MQVSASSYVTLFSKEPDEWREYAALLEEAGYSMAIFHDLKAFMDFLKNHADDIGLIVLSYCNNPDVNDNSLATLLSRGGLAFVPIIADVPEDAEERSHMGGGRLYHVVRRPYSAKDFLTTVNTAFKDLYRFRDLMAEIDKRSSAIGLIRSGTFELRTLREAQNLTTMLSVACPQPKVAALVLSELMVNAIEHGNLDISYEDKSKLVRKGLWTQEIEERIKSPEHAHKKVTITFEQHQDRTVVTIEDMGNGFEWHEFIEFDAKQLLRNHGRGIALAASMENSLLEYKGKGNVVVATFR